jgi:hypothetical protein
LASAWATMASYLAWAWATFAALLPGVARKAQALLPVKLSPQPPEGMIQDLVAQELGHVVADKGRARWAGLAGM